MAELEPKLELAKKMAAPPPAPNPPLAGGNPTDAGSQIKVQLEQKAAQAVAEREQQASLEARLSALEKAFEQSMSGLLGHKTVEGLAKAEDRLHEVEHTVGHLIGFVIHGQHSRLAAIQSWLKKVFS